MMGELFKTRIREKIPLLIFVCVLMTAGANSQNITCRAPSDVVFVLDGSESLSEENFLNMKKFVMSLLKKFEISSAFARVGVIVFGTIPGDIIQLGEVNFVQILNIRIEGLRQPKSGTGTATAIEYMRTMFRERGRKSADKVGIVITDGRSVSPERTKQQAALAKNSSIEMIAIGFGSNVFRTELEQIASSSSHVFESNDFNMLLNEVELAMRELICDVITTTMPTTTTTTTTTTTPAPTTTTTTTTTTPMPTTTTTTTSTPQPTTTTTTTTTPAPITTTLSPIVSSSTTRKALTPIPTMPATKQLLSTIISDICPNCIIGRNWGFKPYPGDCTRYISMFPDGNGGSLSSVQKCPFGSWWDSYSLACRYPVDVMCDDDPCRGVSYGAFPMKDVCSGFWYCINGNAYPSCCPKPTQRFMGNGPALNCSEDVPCPDSCPPTDQSKLLEPVVCTRREDPSDRTKYLEYVPGYGDISRPCPAGTVFVLNDCACTGLDDLASLPLETCSPEVYLNFDDSFNDMSGNDIAFGLENVALATKTARFEGNGMINMWRFSNSDFRQSLVIMFEFRPYNSGTSGPIQALVTNCVFSDQEESSLAISVIPANKVVSFRTKTTKGEEDVFVPYDENAMNRVMYMYDGVRLTGVVNNEARHATLRGDILRRQSGIILGAGSKMANFEGWMDDFKLYMCFPSEAAPFVISPSGR